MFTAILGFMLGRRGYSALSTTGLIVAFLVITSIVVGLMSTSGVNALAILGTYFLIGVVCIIALKVIKPFKRTGV